MYTIYFTTPGPIDIRSFTIMGLSAKHTENPIGFFGTGFKYAIAVLLRTGHTITLTSGDNEYVFSTKQDNFRGKDVDLIYCTDYKNEREIELPFTTHLGANWDVWQAYRELVTNTRDEGGTISDCPASRTDNESCITVRGEPVYSVYTNHMKYFLPNSCQVVADDGALRAIIPTSHHDGSIYYRGMYTGTRASNHTYFTYDYVRSIQLTEDRTIKHTWGFDNEVGSLFSKAMSYADLMVHIPRIAADKDCLEYQLSVSDFYAASASDDFRNALSDLDKTRAACPMWVHLWLNAQKPEEERFGRYIPTRYERRMLAKALDVLEFNHVTIDLDSIRYVDGLPNGIMGMASKGMIYLTQGCLDKGVTFIISTLYEEWLHSAKSIEDYTRDMQNVLMDKVGSLMMQVYELEKGDM